MSKVTGGGNLTAVYAFASTDWSLEATPLISIDKKFETNVTGHANSKNLQAECNHEIFDVDITEMFATYIKDPATINDEPYEDGSLDTVTNPVTDCVCIIHYSGKNNAATPQRHVHMFPARVEGGDYSYKANTNVRPLTRFVAVEAGADIEIGTDWFSTFLLDTPTNQTIDEGLYATEIFYNAAT